MSNFETTARPSDDERIETMTKLMKDEKEKSKSNELITQFYPDYDYKEEEVEEEVKSTKSKVCSFLIKLFLKVWLRVK